MTRSVEEWKGKDDDTPVPPRVRLRVFDRYDGRCYICTRKIRAGEYWETDHVKALINGGENREQNLAPACCNCCKPKTARDQAEKSDTYEKKRKHLLPRERTGFRKLPEGYKYSWRAGRAVRIGED